MTSCHSPVSIHSPSRSSLRSCTVTAMRPIQPLRCRAWRPRFSGSAWSGSGRWAPGSRRSACRRGSRRRPRGERGARRARARADRPLPRPRRREGAADGRGAGCGARAPDDDDRARRSRRLRSRHRGDRRGARRQAGDLRASSTGLVAPDAVLATNTSALSVTEIAAATERPERVVGMHFFNPAPVLPLVEVVRAELASRRGRRDAPSPSRSGSARSPIRCGDTPGFVVNRILIPLLNDCVRVLDEAGVSPEDLDTAMTAGVNWPIGPVRAHRPDRRRRPRARLRGALRGARRAADAATRAARPDAGGGQPGPEERRGVLPLRVASIDARRPVVFLGSQAR